MDFIFSSIRVSAVFRSPFLAIVCLRLGEMVLVIYLYCNRRLCIHTKSSYDDNVMILLFCAIHAGYVMHVHNIDSCYRGHLLDW